MKPTFLLATLLCFPVFAGEHTVKSEPFKTSFTVEGRFLPTEATVLAIEPKQWSSFVIAGLVDHGSSVKKGDILIAFEREDFDKALAEGRKEALSRKLQLAMAQRELGDLELSTPRLLAAEKLKFERNKESLDYFTKTGRALEEEEAAERLDSSKRQLSYVEEELKQLLKMYEEDGVTEETEEIILTRQRSSVKSAQFNLKRAELSTTWSLEKTIPRKAVDLQADFEAASLAYETATINLPRTLELKRLGVAKALRDDAEGDRKLKELEADGAFLTVTAPAAGLVYYGEIRNGDWSVGNAPKFLVENGTAPGKTSLMTLVPAAGPLALYADLDQSQRLRLPVDAKGTAEVTGLPDSAYPVEVSALEVAPDVDGNFALKLTVTLPETSPVVGGMKAQATLVTYENEAAIVVPKATVITEDGKSTVKVKMADGKDETRVVKIGHRNDDMVEILEGLTADQVVLIPDAE